MSADRLTVLYEDNHCLAVLKPAGTLSMGDRTGDASMVDAAREYLRAKYCKPGNVFVGVVHRLDRPVSGVLLYARTTKAASRLSESFRSGTVCKTYVAAVTGTPQPGEGTLHDWLLKDRKTNHVRCVSEATTGAKACCLKYRVIVSGCRGSLLEIEPITGRSHQIRVQLAARDLPIIGDSKYGRTRSGASAKPTRQIALHASSLHFMHPTRREMVEVTAGIPDSRLFDVR